MPVEIQELQKTGPRSTKTLALCHKPVEELGRSLDQMAQKHHS